MNSLRDKVCVGGYARDLNDRRVYLGPVDVSCRWRLDVDECFMAMDEADVAKFLRGKPPGSLKVYRIDPTGQYQEDGP